MFPDLQPGQHLLFDNASVADTYRLRRMVHQPKLDPLAPILRPEKPWEGTRTQPIHVVSDGARGAYRMWYLVFEPALKAARENARSGAAGRVGEPQHLYICYAESQDGILWERPPLNIYPHASGPNNVCFKGFSGAHGTILHRPDAPADERYVMATLDWFSTELGGVCLAFSADGLRWRYKRNEPVVFGHSDTSNCLVWNAERRVYMLYMRAWHAAAVNWPALRKANARRRVAYSESSDLEHWTEPQIILTPDELDPNDFYGIHVFKYGGYYLGQLWVYDEDGEETIDVELVYSHDGFSWSRLPERPTFIPHGSPGDPDGYMVFPAQSPVVSHNALYIYYSGVGAPHGACQEALEVGFRARLRMDGFLSLNADARHGSLITRPFVLQGDHIEMNAACYGNGEMVAELCEPYYHETEGKPVEGFTAADFDLFRGDSIRHRLSWRGKTELSILRGKRLMLRILLRHAELFSFKI